MGIACSFTRTGVPGGNPGRHYLAMTWTFTYTGAGYVVSPPSGTRILVCPICPDLLDHDALGAADNLRGRAVRAFFWLMKAWPT